MDTKNMTMQKLVDELTAAAYEYAVAHNRYDELRKAVHERLAEMQKQIEEVKP